MQRQELEAADPTASAVRQQSQMDAGAQLLMQSDAGGGKGHSPYPQSRWAVPCTLT